MGNAASVKWVGKIPGVNKSFGYKWTKDIDRGLGKALGTVRDPPPPVTPPAPPESIDEGAYMARDRTRRRARLAASSQGGPSAPYSAEPKKLLGA